MKRTQCEKQLRDIESRKFYAEEVCWGLAIALDMGLSREEALDFVSDDYKKWSDLVDKTQE